MISSGHMINLEILWGTLGNGHFLLESDSRGVPMSIDYPFYNPLGDN